MFHSTNPLSSVLGIKDRESKDIDYIFKICICEGGWAGEGEGVWVRVGEGWVRVRVRVGGWVGG